MASDSEMRGDRRTPRVTLRLSRRRMFQLRKQDGKRPREAACGHEEAECREAKGRGADEAR